MLTFEILDTLRNGAIRFMNNPKGLKRKEITPKKLAKILCAYINSIGEDQGCDFNLTVEHLYKEEVKE